MQRRWLPYLVALAAVCAALGLRGVLDPWLGARVPYITLFGAIIVAAWYGGAGPALLAAAAAWIAAQLLFVEPRGQIHLRSVQDLIEIVAYALSSLLIAGLGGAMQSARRAAATKASSASAPSCRTRRTPSSSRTKRGVTSS